MNDKCAVITGTIIPNVLIHGHDEIDAELRREYQDEAIRRKIYLEALSTYNSILNVPIYFLENSSYDFSKDIEFQNLFQMSNIVLLKYPKSEFTEKGKGYQEFEMIDAFVRNFSDQYRSFVKISGRYQFRNISKLIETQTDSLVIDLLRRCRVAITSIFYATFDFYKTHLTGIYRESDDRQAKWIERILYQKLSGEKFREQVQLFPIEPDLIYINGSDKHIASSAVKQFKLPVRNVERAILRHLGINEIYL